MRKMQLFLSKPGKYYPLGFLFLLVFIFGLLINDALAEKTMTIGPTDQTSKILMGIAGSKVGIGGDPGSYNLYVNGTISAGGFNGPLTGALNAQFVSAGTFGAQTGGGNYYFPANVYGNFIGNSTSASNAYYIYSQDTRSTNDLPQDFNNIIKFDFKSNGTNGLSDGGGYNGVMTWRKYGGTTDFSGGPAIQLAYTDNGNLWYRLSASASSWQAWAKLRAGYADSSGTATNLSGGSVNGTTGYFSGSVSASMNNATGGGIILSDDGDIADLNDAYASMRFSYGVRIYSANKGGSPVITLGSNGVVTASSFSGAFSGSLNASNISAGTFGSNTGGGSYAFGGLTSNGISHYQWTPATYYDPGSFSPTVLIRQDNANTGINSFKPALSLYNDNGSANSTVGLVFVSKESNGGGNSVDLSGIMGVKESAGNSGGWSAGGLNFFVKNYGTRIDAMYINSGGSVGIGNTGPGYKLDVSGDINTNSYVYANELYTRDNVYLAYMGNWLSNLLNQNVRTDSNPTFNSTYLANGNLRLYQGDGTALRVQTAYGWMNLGAQNSGWTHMYSDKAFYFNQNLYINGNRVYADDYHPGASNADTVDGQHFSWSNRNNNPTYFWAADSNGDSYLAWRAGMSVSYADLAGRANRANGNFYVDDNYGNTVVGNYTSTRYQGVFAMGDAYKLPADGSSTGNLYGLAWSHPNAGGVASNLNTHGLLVMENGTFLAAISGSIRARDDIQAPIFYDRNNTAYYSNPDGYSRLWMESRQRGYDDVEYDYNDTGYYVDPNGSSRFNYMGRNYGYNWTEYDWNDGSYYVDPNQTSLFNDLRANIFYDRQDTGYYLDPNGSSRLNRLYYVDQAYIVDVRPQYLYDWNDSTYYMDFNNTSRLYNLQVDSSVTSSYFYGSGSIRLGDMWGGAGLYRPSGDMVFGTQNGSWQFSSGAVTKATIGTNGNIWMEWSGEWLSTTLGRKGDRWNDGWGPYDANSIGASKSGFTYAAGAPYNGPLVHFDASGYDLELNATYGGGYNFAYRTRNGDAGSWNGWQNIYSDSYRPYTDNAGALGGIGSGSFFHVDSWQWNHYSGSDGTEYATDFRDSNDGGYHIDPNGSSRMNTLYYVDQAYIVDVRPQYMYDWNDSTYYMDFNSTSRIYNLQVDASVTAGAFVYSSDRNLKQNINTIQDPLEKITKLRGVTFNWKKDNTPSVGLIAQEVEKVFPELVETKMDGFKGVQYGNLVAPLIEAVKQQQTEIEQSKTQQVETDNAQQQEIDALKAQIKLLEAKIRKK